MPQRLGKQADDDILKLLGRFRKLTLPQIADVIGLSITQVRNHVRRLTVARRVVQDRKVKPFQYTLTVTLRSREGR